MVWVDMNVYMCECLSDLVTIQMHLYIVSNSGYVKTARNTQYVLILLR